MSLGLIISFSLLFAAGAALYENPQVRQWVDESRRKVAVALHSLGDELAPQQSDEREQRRRDASTREDESAEAAERRRRARQEILERGRMMEERRRAAAEEQQQQPNKGKGKSMSFDDLVDKDGSLKKEEAEPEVEAPIATTTAAEPNFQGQQAGLRHRGASTGESSSNAAAALGATVANPFVDENFVDRFGSWEEARWAAENESRSPTPTLASPPVPPKPAAYQPQTLLIDTADVVSNHPSEQLVSLTPTTTASSAAADLAELDQGDRRPQASSPESYLSVDEWAQEQSVHQSFHSPPQSLADALVHSQQPHNNAAVTGEGSVADSVEHASQAGTEDIDVMSEFEDGINTPSTWTEVGSMASE